MKWMDEIVKKWASGVAHVFLLHGNTGDLVDDGASTVQVALVAKNPLCLSAEAVVMYDRSKGISFPRPSCREAFYRAVGLDVPADGDGDLMLPRDPVGAFRLIERVLLQGRDTGSGVQPLAAVVISHVETLVPAADLASMSAEERTVLVTLRRWAQEPEFVSLGPPVFLVAENLLDVHPGLRSASSRVEPVHVPYPDYGERLGYIESTCAAHGVEVEDAPRIAALTAGLNRLHIGDIILRAKSESLRLDAGLAKARKEEIVRAEFSEVLELVEPQYGFEAVGGMDHVKEFFLRNVIRPLRSGNLRRVPLGVLLPGPPGTGKTLIAGAVAKETGLNCALLNISRMFDRWVGSSERLMEKALECIKALAPCLVIVDEIDQMGLGRENSGDSGVSNRLFRRLLEFMSDTSHRGRIVFVGLTNRPDLLDPALKRPGRFDRKVPVLPPGRDERRDIFRVVFEKYGIACTADLGRAAAATEGYTGAEIEALVLKALEVAEDSGSAVVEDCHLEHALQAYIPTTRDVQAQVRLALAECNDRDLVPPEYRRYLEPQGRPRNGAAYSRGARVLVESPEKEQKGGYGA